MNKHITIRTLAVALLVFMMAVALTACVSGNTGYTVAFDSNGGSPVDSIKVNTGTAAARPADPTREGATFLGWYLNGTEYDFSAPVNGNITLTARWQFDYTVVFQAADGTVLKTETVSEGGTATAPEAPVRTGYQFTGWDKAFDNVTSDLTVKAVYTRVFVVSFTDYDGIVLHTEVVRLGGSATAPADPARDGFAFIGWDKSFDNVTSDLVVNAVYEPLPGVTTYTVTFVDHDGTELKVQTVAEGKAATAPAAPTRPGHIFTGWDKSFDNITADMTVTATYREAAPAVTYTVTFVDHDGTELKVQTVEQGSRATAPAAPSRPGFDFIGWDKDFSNITSDLTVTAQYGPITHCVTFDANGGSAVPTATVGDGETVTEPAAPTLPGYIFTEWQLNGVKYDFSTPVTHDITLVASYKSDGTVPAATNITVELWPRELEVWTDLTLQINVRPAGVRMRLLDNSTVAFEFVSTNPALVSVTNDGTFTSHGGTGTAVIYARCTAAGSYTSGSTTYSVAVGDILNSVTVTVVEKPDYLKLAEADPETQQITLPSASGSRINVADYIAYPAGDYGSASIALWYGGATSVFTMTADDNHMGEFSQWGEFYDEYGIPVTLMAPTGGYAECAAWWAQQPSIGNLVQSHGSTHLNGDLNYVTTAEFWYDQYLGSKHINAAGVRSLIIGYPYGGNYRPISSLIYIAGRGTAGHINNTAEVNYNCTGSFSGFPQNMADQVAGMFATDTTSKWMSVHYHNIGDENVVRANYDYLKPYIDSGRLWAATFAAAAQYGQERDTATLTVTSATSNLVTFTLTDLMNDMLFDHALSVRIKVDASWQHARAYQGGEEIAVKIETVDGETYLVVDAVPDCGQVSVARTEIFGLSQTASEIRFNPVGAAAYPDKFMTMSFAVDGAVWQYVYAMQGSTKLDAYTETRHGVTTLYVTAMADGGEVVLVPVTDQFADRTEYTMAEIHERQMPLDASKPVTISSAAELNMLAELVNAGNSCSGVTFLLTCDLDMAGQEYSPIGWELIYEKSSGIRFYTPFSGTFDGQGHRIYDLTLNDAEYDTGIFGYTDGATIERLHVEGNISGSKRVGAIVGHAVNTVISRCSFSGSVLSVGDDDKKNSGSYTGGIVGQISGGMVEHCTVSGNIVAHAAVAESSGLYTGGIVGHFGSTLINNCCFVGTVTAYEAADGSGARYVGGIAGTASGGPKENPSRIFNCLADATVTGSQLVGGIIGEIHSPSSGSQTFVHNCVAYGKAVAGDCVGGISGATGINNVAQIKNCVALNKVKAADGARYVGTVVGRVTKGGNWTIIEAYYDAELNPGMAAYCFNEGSATTGHAFKCNPVSDTTLSELNTAAAKDAAYYPWQMIDGVLTPCYTEVYTVTFLDKDGAVLSVQNIPTGLSATAPAAPVFQGFEFTGWDKTFDAVTEDMTVTALYDRVVIYTVTFKGQGGEGVLKTEQVNDGLAATAPAAPAVEGYRFDRWSVSFDNVTSDLEVVALYVKTYDVTFLYEDGSVYKVITVDDGAAVTPPSGPIVEGKIFEGWVGLPASVTADVTVNPTYKVKPPIAAADYKIMQWNVAGNMQYAVKDWKKAVTAAVTDADPDIFVMMGVSGATLGQLSIDGYGCIAYGSGTGEVNFRYDGGGFAVFYKTDKFAPAGELTPIQTGYRHFGGIVVPLITPEGRTVSIVPTYLNGWNNGPKEADVADWFAAVDAALGRVDCAVVVMHLCDMTLDKSLGYTSAFTRASANEGYSYTATAGLTSLKDGEQKYTNFHADYIITYSQGAPTATAAELSVVECTTDLSVYPNFQANTNNSAFYTKATVTTVAIGATD